VELDYKHVILAIGLFGLATLLALLPWHTEVKNPWEGMSTEGGWADSSWDYVLPININTTVATNLTNFPARVRINTSNGTLFHLHNYSTITAEAHGKAMTNNSFSAANYYGVVIQPKTTITLYNVTMGGNTTPTNLLVQNSARTILANVTFTGIYATPNINLTQGELYYLLFVGDATFDYVADGTPYEGTTIRWVNGLSGTTNSTAGNLNTGMYGFVSLNTLSDPAACRNIRFYDYNNTTLLNYDLDSDSPIFCGNSSNNATYWVSTNLTGGALTTIYAYLGNTGATSGENEAAVWRAADYVGVYHLNENTTSIIDSAGFNNLTVSSTYSDCALNNTPYGNGIFFNGSCYINKTSASSLPPGNATVSVILWKYGTVNQWQDTFGFGNPVSPSIILGEMINTDKIRFHAGTGSDWDTGLLKGLNKWTMPAISYNTVSHQYAYNTTTNATSSGSITPAPTQIMLSGWSDGNSRLYQTIITEARIRNTTSSQDWLTAEYAQIAIVGAPHPAWWDYNYKVQVNITDWNCTSAYCQFPIPIALNATATNGSDIRVLDSSETGELGFWRQEGSSLKAVTDWNYTNASGYLWVNASNQTSIIYIYYNASEASDKSSITDIGGDNFAGTSLNASWWSAIGGGTSVVENSTYYYTGADAGVFTKFVLFNTSNLADRTIYAKFDGIGGTNGDDDYGGVKIMTTGSSDEATMQNDDLIRFMLNRYNYACGGGGKVRSIGNATAFYMCMPSMTFPEIISFSTINNTDKGNGHLFSSTQNAASNSSGTTVFTTGYPFTNLYLTARQSTINKVDWFIITPRVTATPSFVIGAQEEAVVMNASISHSAGIYATSFRPIHAYATNVQPVNQTSDRGLFNITTNSAGTFKINASQTPSIPGFTVKCAPNYNQTGLLTLNATSQWIADVTYPASQMIWCWADFSNPQPRWQSFNVSINGNRYE